MYKLENGKLIASGKVVYYDGKATSNPTDSLLLELGYKPLIESEAPELPEGKMLVSHYEETAEAITLVYEIVDIPTEETEEVVNEENA